jgi:hypothetical protein
MWMLRRRVATVARTNPLPARSIISPNNCVGVESLLELALTVLVGGGVPMSALVTMLAEQIIRAPPPLAEPLPWLIVTSRAEAVVPVAVQAEWRNVTRRVAEQIARFASRCLENVNLTSDRGD